MVMASPERKITYLSLPSGFDAGKAKLTFFLAMEEFAARNLSSYPELFFMWRVSPTVIFGRNQVIYNEVNVEYCQSHSIDFFRRKSGGGCVYADMGNIMMSYITTSDEVTTTFSSYTSRVAFLLRRLGLNAEATGRNDVVVDGMKVSGNAFYHIPHRSIVHGTMLYSTDIGNMLSALTPSAEKMLSKGVVSVKSRITTLENRINLDIIRFMDFIRRNLCDDEVGLSSEDVEKIRQIERQYTSLDFIYGKNPSANVVRKARFNGVGEIEARFNIVAGKIHNLSLSGDFFPVGDIDSIISSLEGVSPDAGDISSAISHINMPDVILNMSNKQFITLFIP